MKAKDELVNYWLRSSEIDLNVAESMFNNGHYHYCLFIGHLVLEKTLKAIYVNRIDNTPPYKHSLVLLASKCDLILSDDQLQFLEEVSDFNLEARYPDEKFSFHKKCNKEFTQTNLKKIEEIREWLLQPIQ